LGLDEFPGLLTYVGGTIIIVGLFILLFYQEVDLHHIEAPKSKKDIE
jgi:hypothetical protein